MRKWVCSTLFAMALAFCTPFAYAIDVCKQVVCRFANEHDSFGKAVAKLKVEMAFAFGGRSTEAGRANGLVKESHGFRLSEMFAAFGLPLKVGWRQATHI